MRIIKVICDAGHLDTIEGIAEQKEVTDFWWHKNEEDDRIDVNLLVRPGKRQAVLDSLQKVLDTDTKARILITPIDSVVAKASDKATDGDVTLLQSDISRQELYDDVERSARLDGNYIVLVTLSTIVAAIGLIENNVAVVVGAMVIAPLLGPNIALALGSALGDMHLLWRATKCIFAGIGLAVLLSICIVMIWPLTAPYSTEVLSRTVVGLATIALALASGAAGALSMTRGLPSVLVGVMVAVAILPPAATFGMMLGVGEFEKANGAVLLLAVNIVCINLSAKLVFLLRGIQPRTWSEQQRARTSVGIAITMWVASLAILIAVIYFK